ncbi:hypothetical protein AVEN_121622-1 [Araneus ventricosus]|uniref:Uncharacterized protein n=1 Tax=Araneus ventricosus TaxID=182803 RepID=A0A4Y2V1Z9_ARAVE|nr:hypothetical protein AVEN_121622-1 [Araneus ventricosus]
MRGHSDSLHLKKPPNSCLDYISFFSSDNETDTLARIDTIEANICRSVAATFLLPRIRRQQSITIVKEFDLEILMHLYVLDLSESVRPTDILCRSVCGSSGFCQYEATGVTLL